jgi:undecaprenyl-diphosphatase
MFRTQFLLFFLFCFFGAYGQNPDINLLKSINPDTYTPAAHFAHFESEIAHPLSFAIPIGLLADGYFTKDKLRKEKSTGILLGVAAADLVNWGFKLTFHRPRPYVTWPGDVYPWGSGSSYSMPSGHTAEAFGLAAALSFSYPKWYVAVPAYLWAGSIGWSRMALGVHYPSDVLVGALVGTASGIGMYYLVKYYFNRHPTLFAFR